MNENILTSIVIPDDVKFSDLKLVREPDGDISFAWEPIERICRGSGVDIAFLRDGPEENVVWLIRQWYEAHRAAGGAPDPVEEDILAEVLAEDAAGQHFSYEPGRA